MITKIITVTIASLILLYIAIPSEWKCIYSSYNLKSTAAPIMIPVRGISKNDIEDTYGAYRSDERNHEGLDLFAARGTEVRNCCKGIILYTGRDVYGGNTVRVFGEDNRIYYYAHLDRYADIKEGQIVNMNDLLGYVGNTGNALGTMPHLHFEIMEIDWLFPLIKTNINPYQQFRN